MIDLKIDINILPVGLGDCIHIRYNDGEKNFNIIIDSGNTRTSCVFENLLDHIAGTGEVIEVLCFTHIHDDHINAAEIVLEDGNYNNSFIKSAWLNMEDIEDMSDPRDMTIMSSLNLQRILKDLDISIENEVIAGRVFTFGGAKITIISPNEVKRDAFKQYLEREMTPIDMAAADTDESNGDSIAFVFSLGDNNILFLGDAHRDSVIEGIKTYCNGISFDAVKLAHHGSPRNINARLLSALNTNAFIVSSTDVQFKHRVETLNLISQYNKGEEKYVLCNFDPSSVNYQDDCVKMVNLTENEYKVKDITIRTEVY